MTIVVAIKVNDGIVLAADSAASLIRSGSDRPDIIYNNANKIFNLVKGLPIGVMTFGSASIGNSSLGTLIKDLRQELTSSTASAPSDSDATVFEKTSYTLEEVTENTKEFIFEKKYMGDPDNIRKDMRTGLWIAGYSVDSSEPELWGLSIERDKCSDPNPLSFIGGTYGIRWAGDGEALDRLILGLSGQLVPALVDADLKLEEARNICTKMLGLIQSRNDPLTLPAMPIQDAIDLAEFLVETAIRFAKFGIRAETVGGPIEIATITKHEGFKWIKRKHYYDERLNRGGHDGQA